MAFRLNRPAVTETPFFSEPPVWLLVAENAPERTCIPLEHTADGPVIRCFLSQFDAMIEAELIARRSRMRYYAVPASEIDRALFRAPRAAGFIAYLHVGWFARSGRILLRLDGLPAGCHQPLRWSGSSAGYFEVDRCMLAMVERLHERAGLFAWRETLREVDDWGGARWAQAQEQALRSLSGLSQDGEISAANQLALFDPEAGQWHLVPIDDAADCDDRS
ncbi:MAG: hypothetical protein EPN73_23145 [Paraburkholderia sp.]|uniref:hypothetical protein n=1 Tax=Paraburkholderia sp. TaxID=1926495 RepID=UPI00122A2E50|nr:hypothetical protein [Paraburkholderia sp.]TAL93012.1 MAG: hypothetical protein EPN73_23145 [Paraburkholderia sp.]